MKEDLWVVIVWEYGRHCDEFVVNKVIGPLSFKEAEDLKMELEALCKSVKIAPIEGKINDRKTSLG